MKLLAMACCPTRMTRHTPVYVCAAMILAGCGTGYKRTTDQVAYVTLDEGRGKVSQPIQGADPSSFVILKNGYAKDKWQLYFEGRAFWSGTHFYDQAPSSFTVLANGYARDDERAYYRGSPIARVDMETFHVARDGNWARDKKDIYIGPRALHACAPESFQWLDDFWHRDNKCVYRTSIASSEARIPGADPKTFSIVNFWYGKDANHVYTNEGTILVGADPKSFVDDRRTGGGRDSNRCFLDKRIVPCR